MAISLSIYLPLSRTNNRETCSPYRNQWLIASQLAQIIAFLLAYKFMGIFFIGFVSMMMQQLLWCCRQNKTELLISSMLSVLAAGVATWSGIYVLLNWRDPEWCQPVFFFLFWKPGEIKCGGRDSAALAFIGASLWLASAVFTIVFVVANKRDRQTVGDSGEENLDTFDCEAIQPITYHPGQRKSRKNSVIVSKSEQFAPPDGSYEPERAESRKTSITVSKSEQFAPPEGTFPGREESRKTSNTVSKSEQFAPPEDTFPTEQPKSR